MFLHKSQVQSKELIKFVKIKIVLILVELPVRYGHAQNWPRHLVNIDIVKLLRTLLTPPRQLSHTHSTHPYLTTLFLLLRFTLPSYHHSSPHPFHLHFMYLPSSTPLFFPNTSPFPTYPISCYLPHISICPPTPTSHSSQHPFPFFGHS